MWKKRLCYFVDSNPVFSMYEWTRCVCENNTFDISICRGILWWFEHTIFVFHSNRIESNCGIQHFFAIFHQSNCLWRQNNAWDFVYMWFVLTDRRNNDAIWLWPFLFYTDAKRVCEIARLLIQKQVINYCSTANCKMQSHFSLSFHNARLILTSFYGVLLFQRRNVRLIWQSLTCWTVNG